MAKPSVTNIRPPTTPPKTAWDLNATADQADSNYHVNTGGSGDAFDTTVVTINIPAHGPAFDFNDYGYVFYGVNGGVDETIIGNNDLAGVIVSGNGKDHVTGGQWDDVIMSGNGADVDHGGGGNDIIYGENGPDQLYGDADDGTANFVAPDEGQGPVLTVIDGAVQWDHDPNTESEISAIPNKTTVEKDGFYIALDGDGHPTELDGDGHPIVHVVYDITPETTGWYTVAYDQGNNLDGPGEPAPDQFQVLLTAGNTYHYSFVYDNGHGPDRVDVFAGQIAVTDPINDGPGGNPGSVATSQALPDPGWETFFTSEEGPPGGNGVREFVAGDQLIGGNGPDQFIWDAHVGPQNVDLIWDFDQSSGTYDQLEGDQLIIQNTGLALADLTAANSPHVQMMDLNSDTVDDVVIFISQDHAIGLVGIHDINTIAANITIT